MSAFSYQTSENPGTGHPATLLGLNELVTMTISGTYVEMITRAAIDLERLEWFRVPAATGERHVAGPFVDCLCSNEVTLTASMPVFMDDAFVGVACADVLAADLEAEMLPLISRLGDAGCPAGGES